MATEPDQTKWVGIRPTPDCNDIPTTTRKLAPAIGDLQAVKDRYGEELGVAGVNCSVVGALALPAVTAGEIWVVTTITAINENTMCDIALCPRIDGGWRMIKNIYSVEPDIRVSWHGMIVLINPDYVRCTFALGGAADTVYLAATGYKIGEY